MQGFTMIDLIILVVYLAAVLFAGLHFAKKDMKGCPGRGPKSKSTKTATMKSAICWAESGNSAVPCRKS